jgi:2-polyprenyl-3-methyl-5-hydroxy-6-metoxy-1,4-benzoquinol methylase
VDSPDIFVIRRNQISAIVKKIAGHQTNQLTAVKVKAVYEQLYPYTQVNEMVKDQHVKNIQNKKTLQYYDQNASQFVSGTQMVDFTETQEKFIKKLKPNSCILDFGCGSGRDTKYFMNHGFQVETIDGSTELCKHATEFTGIPVKQMFFADLKEESKYDAIWACASILHLPKEKLKEVIGKMVTAIKKEGILYTSFKYGTFEGERNGRYFTDMTEDTFAELISENMELKIEEQWITSDVRKGRGAEKWLNLILRKK